MLYGGGIIRAGKILNFNEPGAVRALLDEALAHGWNADAEEMELDGWGVFDAVLARRLGTTDGTLGGEV